MSQDTSSKTANSAGVKLTADWLKQPALVRLVAALSVDGTTPRVVGGCVRDAILDRPVTDIDLATPLQPGRVMTALKVAGIKAVPTGFDHGTVTAVVDSAGYEITTLRHDVETDGRRAIVAFTDDWRVDAARRDFTINAMSADLDGTVYDFFGGIGDAQAGIVRFVGDAATRLQEDYLRILRFFRFQAWYGRQIPSDATLHAIETAAPGLDGLAAERIGSELLKWLGAPDPRSSWEMAEQAGVVGRLFGEAVMTSRLNGVVALELANGLSADPLRRLAGLVVKPGPGAGSTASQLRLSKAQERRIAAIAEALPAAAAVKSVRDARHLAYRWGIETANDALMLQAADYEASDYFRDAFTGWGIPVFPVTGADAKAMGLSAGPRIGAVLRQVETWWLAEDFAPDRTACLKKLKSTIGTVQ